jgi:ubiquitin-small subunit ribosomal protein S27Ae
MVDKKATSKGEVSVYKFYSVKDDKITRSKRDCPRCGKGVFMAEHKDRHTCGKCGFTEFAHKEQSKKVNKKQ